MIKPCAQSLNKLAVHQCINCLERSDSRTIPNSAHTIQTPLNVLRGSGFTQMEFPLLLWPPVPLEVNSEKWVKNCPLATGQLIISRLCLIQSGDNIRNHQIQALPLFLQRFEIIRPINYIWRISSELKHICHSVKQSMSLGLTVFKRCLGLNEKRTFITFFIVPSSKQSEKIAW